jgi:hypothetical protein
LVPSSQDLQNGDFLIHQNTGASMSGDGWDETTTWHFDFTSDPHYSGSFANGTLTSALLTLSLRNVWFPGPLTDLVVPLGAGFNIIEIPAFITAHDPGDTYGTGTIQFQLLNHDSTYTASALLGFLSANSGLFPMQYADDAIVYGAKLELTTADVPISGTLWLLVAGLPLLAGRGRKA